MAFDSLKELIKKHGEVCVRENDPVRFLKDTLGRHGFVKYVKRHPYGVLIPGGLLGIVLIIVAFRLLGLLQPACQPMSGWFDTLSVASQIDHIRSEIHLIKGVDPVCEAHVGPHSDNFTSTHAGRTYYFCNEAHKIAFAEDPEKYIAQIDPDGTNLQLYAR